MVFTEKKEIQQIVDKRTFLRDYDFNIMLFCVIFQR